MSTLGQCGTYAEDLCGTLQASRWGAGMPRKNPARLGATLPLENPPGNLQGIFMEMLDIFAFFFLFFLGGFLDLCPWMQIEVLFLALEEVWREMVWW